MQNLCRAYYHHVFDEEIIPYLFVPEIYTHSAEQLRDILIDVVS